MNIQPVILSGGSGTRLWPFSREAYPKQFLRLITNHSLLQETIQRLDGMPLEHALLAPVVVCNEIHRFLVAEQLQEVGAQAGNIILEPVARNTAPALTLAALAIQNKSPDALMLVMPADHVVINKTAFHQAVQKGILLAEAGKLVTFGINPDSPATGYGYIQIGDVISCANPMPGHQIARFVEKPDFDTATRYLDEGGYLWNSGIFLMRVDRWLEEINRYRPEILNACQAAFASSKRDTDFMRVGASAFESCPSDSIDYAVMEHLTQEDGVEVRGAVVPMDAGWSDVGAWPSLWDIGDKDQDGNVLKGDVFVSNSSNNLIYSQGRLIAGIGIEDLVITETPDAIMIAHKDHAQDVKHVVSWLNSSDRPESKLHREVARPWGTYEGVVLGERFQVKRIIVKPGASLSLQMHHHRAEHWIVVKGTARVTRGDEVFLVSENQSTYIPIGTLHRLENPGKLPLEMIEVQSGSYLGEDDIVRYDDIYGREGV